LQGDLALQVGVGRRHRLLLAEVAVVGPVGKTYQVRRKSVTADMGGLPDEVVETCGEGTGERRAGAGAAGVAASVRADQQQRLGHGLPEAGRAARREGAEVELRELPGVGQLPSLHPD